MMVSTALAGSVVTVSCAKYHTAAVVRPAKKDQNPKNDVLSWGIGASRLAQPGVRTQSFPRKIPGNFAGKSVVAISSSIEHCVAVCSDGKVFSWGQGSDGQLGHGYDQHNHNTTIIDDEVFRVPVM